MDIRTLFNNAFQKLQASGDIEAMVEARVKKSVESALDDLLGWRGLQKQLTDSLNEHINVDLKNVGLPRYNEMVLRMVRESLGRHLIDGWGKRLDSQIAELLADAPQEMNLSALLEQICNDTEPGDVDGEYLWSEVEDTSSGHIVWVKINPGGSPRFSSSPRYRFLVNAEKAREISALRIDGQEAEKFDASWRSGATDRLLLRLHLGGTKVTCDLEPGEHTFTYPFAP